MAKMIAFEQEAREAIRRGVSKRTRCGLLGHGQEQQDSESFMDVWGCGGLDARNRI